MRSALKPMLTLGVVALIGSSLTTIQSVNAADGATTKGTINFIDDAGKTEPVNPTDPSETIPADPNNPSTGNAGTLTIDVAPQEFNFGTVATSFAAKTYYPTESHHQYLQITDKRTDTNGWQVNVKQNRPLTNDDNQYALSGATITLPKGTARNSLGEPASAPDPKLTVAEPVVISATDQPVITAASVAGTGKATSTNTWQADSVKLSIPAMTAKVGQYSNTLTWSLVANPSN